MTFRKQLELHLDKLLGSTATKQQRADTCGVDYNYYVNIASGSRKPPSDEKILEISRKLKLGDKESVELLALAIQEKIKDQDTRGILDRYFDSDSTPTLKPSLPETFAAPDNLVVLNEEPHKIPIYTSIKAGNGEMGVTDGEADGEIFICDEYKKMKVFAMKVSGDSMSTELYDGEIALFKPINGDARREKDIYAVEVEGWSNWVVKFVREDASGMVQLISANQYYPVKEIDPKISRVTLRGKLIESRRIRK